MVVIWKVSVVVFDQNFVNFSWLKMLYLLIDCHWLLWRHFFFGELIIENFKTSVADINTFKIMDVLFRFLLSFSNIFSLRAFDSIFHLITWILKLVKFHLLITNLLKHLVKNIVSIFDSHHVLFSSLYINITDIFVIDTVNDRSIRNIIEKHLLFI